MIFYLMVAKRPATLSNEPKECYTILFMYDNSLSPVHEVLTSADDGINMVRKIIYNVCFVWYLTQYPKFEFSDQL